MQNYNYKGRGAFQEDKGTLWFPNKRGVPINKYTTTKINSLIRFKRGNKLIVWFVDDEKRNRKWFVDYHCETHFIIITFSSIKSFSEAMNRKIYCDVVVTDIFFPVKKPITNNAAKKLLFIYKKIESTKTKDLGKLWQNQSKYWVLAGFEIIRILQNMNLNLPVFLFSRKATMLLNMEKINCQYPHLYKSNWLLEKIDPSKSETDDSVFIADTQYKRISYFVNRRIESNQAFVAMHFDRKTNGIFKQISKAIRDIGYDVMRIDLKEHNNKIDDEIIKEIRKSKFLVADFTGNRGNVYFEAGFAIGLNIPVIWTCKKNQLINLNFDTRQYNFIVWEDDRDLYKGLMKRIKDSIVNL